jgi:acyl-CoA synthetase (AMP-forming)/AMP-acid ligase II
LGHRRSRLYADGELFVTGRSADLIIKGGRNLYPQEIEELTAVPGVRRGCVAAIGIKDEVWELKDWSSSQKPGSKMLCER